MAETQQENKPNKIVLPRNCLKSTHGRKEYAPPPWHPSFLGLSPDPEATEQTKLWCIPFSWENKEKCIHRRSGKKGIHHRGLRPWKWKKEGFHGGGVYFFFPATYFQKDVNIRFRGYSVTACKTPEELGCSGHSKLTLILCSFHYDIRMGQEPDWNWNPKQSEPFKAKPESSEPLVLERKELGPQRFKPFYAKVQSWISLFF